MQTVLVLASAILTTFLLTIASTVLGSLVGWVVQLTCFGTWVKSCFNSLGVTNISLVDLGAALGFIGPFFKSKLTL